jgi:hypothetical protein
MVKTFQMSLNTQVVFKNDTLFSLKVVHFYRNMMEMLV